jgi:AcrR family transcriptional regulator
MAMRTQLDGNPNREAGLRERKRLSTRRELVQAGRALFSREGIYDSRIEDITKHAGIAKGTLYLHFRSKEDLVLAVVTSGFEQLRSHVDERLRGSATLRDVAAAIFSAHVEFFERNADLMRIFHQVRGVLKFDRPRWRPLRTQLRLHVEFLAERLARGEARSWSLARRRELAVFLFGCASGTSSVLVSTYAESARLGRWQERWSDPVARAATASTFPLRERVRRRGRRP